MKTPYYLIAIFAFLIISCSDDDNSQEELNLLEISEKLNSLDPSVINQNENDSEMLLKKNFQNKKASITNDDSCQHTTTETDSYEGTTYTLTASYFDKDMNPITNCDIESQESKFEYNSTESQITDGPNFKYTLNYKRNHVREISNTKLSYVDNLIVLGELNFDGNIFNIIEGSYIYTDYTFSVDFSNQNTEDFYEKFDINYKFEFESNSQIYHFDMLLDGEDLMAVITKEELEVISEKSEITSEKSEIILEYPLYDSTDTQIGIIKYVLDFEKGVEKFILYDLDGNLVE